MMCYNRNFVRAFDYNTSFLRGKMNLIDALLARHPNSSKTARREWIRSGRVLVNSTVVYDIRTAVSENDTVQLTGQKPKWKKDLKIVFEDDSLVVVEKPEGLLSVATDFEKKKTAHSLLKEHYGRKIFVVHRLDRDTSGLMVFALTEEAFNGLKKQLERREIARIYEAVVEGYITGKDMWECYVKEDAAYYMRASDDPSFGERAATHYEVLKPGKRFSVVRFSLDTGKKNQIRVQAMRAGHPITGDKKYGACHDPFKRLALHACRLQFKHPITAKVLSFQSPYKWM